MTGYVCKYTPVELIEAFGEETVKIEPHVRTHESAHNFTHVNMCSYMKGALEQILEQNIGEIVLVNCCDSIRRLNDILKDKADFLHIIDLPRKISNETDRLFYRQIELFIKAYGEYKGTRLKNGLLKEIIQSRRSEEQIPGELLIMGARFDKNIIERLEEKYGINTINLTCSGNNRLSDTITENNVLFSYAAALLRSFPCMRMVSDRLAFLKNLPIKGIIYNTIKFCDFYSFEYANLKKLVNTPILKVETDYTDSRSGQLMNRIDAFMEVLETKNVSRKTRGKRFFAGIDSGSTSTNTVIINAKGQIMGYSNVPTGAKAHDSAQRSYDLALENAGLTKEDISFTVATGYGRISLPFANKATTEISCHGKGAYFLDREVRTIIDIGGQDSKVIRLDEKGNVLDFAMNDKCSAGTGRFLDFMAKAMEIPLEDMSQVIINYHEDIVITSMCTVFAESEVISLIAHNTEVTDIIRGLNRSVATKAVSLLNRIKHTGKYMMTGGVAKNKGVVYEIEQKIGAKLLIPSDPQITGALGAAIFAMESTG